MCLATALLSSAPFGNVHNVWLEADVQGGSKDTLEIYPVETLQSVDAYGPRGRKIAVRT